MSEFGYYRNDQLPQDLVAKAKERATTEIANFGVSLIRDQRLIGSGVLTSVGAKIGILTALHVADLVTGRRETPFGLNIASYEHQFFIAPECIELVVVGKPSSGDFDEKGPDLCFLSILDVNIQANIRSRKSVYRLDGRSFDRYRALPIETMPWWIAGAPDEFSKEEGELGTASHVLAAVHFHAEATFLFSEERGDFDFITLEVTAGSHRFPSDYGGVSGGGIWLAPLTMDPDVGPTSIGYDHPFLAGIVFYQSDLVGGHRRLVGHGPKSIYDCVTKHVTPVERK